MGTRGDVITIRQHEAVARRGRELLSDTDVMEGHGYVLLGPCVLQSQRDPIAGLELEVLDRLGTHDDVVRMLCESLHELTRATALEVRVLELRGVDDRRRVQ